VAPFSVQVNSWHKDCLVRIRDIARSRILVEGGCDGHTIFGGMAMKIVSCCIGALLFVTAFGCTKRSEPGGGSDRASSFKLSGPSSTTSIKQGETQTETIKIERGKDFKQAIVLNAEPPFGVHAELSSTNNKASEKGEVNLKLTASDKAEVGEHTVYVTGTPDNGIATKLELKIKVLDRAGNTRTTTGTPTGRTTETTTNDKDKVRLSLHGPLLATTIKQGETKTIPVSLKQSGGKYDGAVKLSVENPGKGIMTELTSNNIKSADTGEVGLKITADKTADLGEHRIRVTGTTDSGTVEAADVKLKVVAP